MNFGIGIDCVEISRFEPIGKKPRLLDKIFKKNEIKYCNSKSKPSQHFAVRFSAKESIIKAFSKFGKILNFKEIEIVNNSDNRPQAIVTNPNFNDFKAEISLSHSNDFAISVAIVTAKNSESFRL